MIVQRLFILQWALTLVLSFLFSSAVVAEVRNNQETQFVGDRNTARDHSELLLEWLSERREVTYELLPQFFCPVEELSHEELSYYVDLKVYIDDINNKMTPRYPSVPDVIHTRSEVDGSSQEFRLISPPITLHAIEYPESSANTKYVYLYLFPSSLEKDTRTEANEVIEIFHNWNNSIQDERVARFRTGEKYDLAERVCNNDAVIWGKRDLIETILTRRPDDAHIVISDQQNLSSDLSAESLDFYYGIPIPFTFFVSYWNQSLYSINNVTLKFKSLKYVNFPGLVITDSKIYLADASSINLRGVVLKNVDLYGSFSFRQLTSTANARNIYSMFDDFRLWMDEVPDDWHEAWLHYNPEGGSFDVSRKPWRAIPSALLESDRLYVQDERHSYLFRLDHVFPAFSYEMNPYDLTILYELSSYDVRINQNRIIDKKIKKNFSVETPPYIKRITGGDYFFSPSITGERYLSRLKTERDGDFSNFIFFPDETREHDREYSLEGWDLSNLDLTNAKLRNLNLTDVDLTNSIISFCSFEGSWGLTVDQIKSTWNWKTGKTSDIIFPEELLEDPEFKRVIEVQK